MKQSRIQLLQFKMYRGGGNSAAARKSKVKSQKSKVKTDRDLFLVSGKEYTIGGSASSLDRRGSLKQYVTSLLTGNKNKNN